jgi:hypothetical protein
MEIAMKSILARLPKAKTVISSDGKSATVTYPPKADATPDDPPAEPFYCLRDAGGWKIDLLRLDEGGADSATIKNDHDLTKRLDALTTELRAGKIASFDDFKKRSDAIEQILLSSATMPAP